MTVTSLIQSNIIRAKSSVFKQEASQKTKAIKLLVMFLIFSVAVVGALYILQVTTIATKGYEIRGLKKRIGELEDKNRTLQVGISNLKSINALQSKTESFNMIEAEKIEYVILSSPNVAEK
jgi:hypothetical protein